MIHRGIVAGARYPDIYDMTWGEINDFILARNEMRRTEMQEEASLYFSTAMLLMRLMASRNGDKPLSVMDAYPYLWTDKEHADAKAQSFRRAVERDDKIRRAKEEAAEIRRKIAAEKNIKEVNRDER